MILRDALLIVRLILLFELDWIIGSHGSDKLKEIVLKCNLIPSSAPDHLCVLLQFYIRPVLFSKAKRTYWIFNNSLCGDEVYTKQMKDEIINLKQKYQTEIK